MFVTAGRAAAGQHIQPHKATRGTARHNNGFSVMPCDARLREARPTVVPRWHARDQGSSPVASPGLAVEGGLGRRQGDYQVILTNDVVVTQGGLILWPSW